MARALGITLLAVVGIGLGQASAAAGPSVELHFSELLWQTLKLSDAEVLLVEPFGEGPARVTAARIEWVAAESAEPAESAQPAALDPRLATLLPAENIELICARFLLTGAGMVCRDGVISFDAGADSLTLEVTATADRDHLHLALAAEALNYEGVNVAQAVGMGLAIGAARTANGWEYTLDAEMRSGVAYLEPGWTVGGSQPGFLVEVFENSPPVRLRALARPGSEAGTGWEFTDLLFQHPGVIDCAGGMGLDAGEIEWVRASCDVLSASEAYRIWMEPLLLGSALSSLDIGGAMRMDFSYADGVLNHAVFGFDHLFLDDRAGRFSLSDLDGDFILHAGDAVQTSRLDFAGAGLLGLPFGAASLKFESSRHQVSLPGGTEIPLLGGEFVVDTFSVLAPGLGGNRLNIAGALTPISIADLCAYLACPAFEGTLAIKVPSLTLAEGQLTLDGALEAALFGGEVEVRRLVIADMLSRVPRLEADVFAHNINLAQLTSAAAFGRIEGSVDVRLEGLELANWSPVAFDFRLESVPNDRRRHRISQRAVDNIGELGAGAVSPLSGGAFRFIDAYSYGEIAVGCTYRAGACWLSGINGGEDSERGEFLLLSPGGWLPPWIEIRGSGRLLPIEIIKEGYERIREGNIQVRLNESR